MSVLLEKLSTINTFFKTFSIPRKFLIIIVILMLVQSLAEVFSAMLLIPFLNSIHLKSLVASKREEVPRLI